MTFSISSQPVDPSRPTRIYLVRHGTTLLNRTRRYRGRIDVALDEGGWRDAWTAAATLEDAGLQAVYSSPLRRARDTARIVADAAGLATVADMPGLLNLAYGDWDGLTREEAAARDPEAFVAYNDYHLGATIPGGENLDLAAERMVLSMRVLALLHPGGTIAAVSHAATVRLLISAVTESHRADWRRALPNGAVTVFDATPSGVHAVDVPTQILVGE